MSDKVERLRLMRTKQICELLGKVDARTLYEYVRLGKFPKPDRPAGSRGRPNLWYATTVQRGVKQMVRKGNKSAQLSATA